MQNCAMTGIIERILGTKAPIVVKKPDPNRLVECKIPSQPDSLGGPANQSAAECPHVFVNEHGRRLCTTNNLGCPRVKTN